MTANEKIIFKNTHNPYVMSCHTGLSKETDDE